MRTLLIDIHYEARKLWRNPGFTLVAMSALALGFGGGTTQNPAHGRDLASPAAYRKWKGQNHVFGDLAAVLDISNMMLTGSGEPEELLAGSVTANFFQRIGVQPMMGRSFLPGEDTAGRERVVILSHGLWQRRFGSDTGAVGRRITLSKERYRVIGILPSDFTWNNRQTDVWVPYVAEPGRDSGSRESRYLSAVDARGHGAVGT
jgi:putative ABC transport system permease protein